MNIQMQGHKIELVLKKRQLLTLKEAQPKMAIECRQGVIWVTNSGEPHDFVLEPGSNFVPSMKGRLVIEAIDDACVDIEEA